MAISLLAVSVAATGHAGIVPPEVFLFPVCADPCIASVGDFVGFITVPTDADFYQYDWGDGSPPEMSNNPVPGHTWAAVGIFAPTLIVVIDWVRFETETAWRVDVVDSRIFSDGFETGDLGAWSVVVVEP